MTLKLMLSANIPKQKGFIDYNASILSIGSCFSDTIGHKLSNSKFNININPVGIIFNPESVLNVLQNSLINKIDSKHILKRDENWLSYDFHSDVIGSSRKELEKNIGDKNTIMASALKSCSHLFITFGTAMAYRLKSSGKIVANCHKTENPQFEKHLLDLSSLVEEWGAFISQLTKFNSEIKILFTVSPVRHKKDGLRENNISKGILHQLVHQLENEYLAVNYFPSYELLIDELRDYRYFASDLVHPSELAIEYIYEKFQSSYFDDITLERQQLVNKINQAKAHRFLTATESQKKKQQELTLKLETQLKNIKP